MSHIAYIVAGYGLSAAILGSYAAWAISRERSLARDLGLTSTRRPRPDAPAPAE